MSQPIGNTFPRTESQVMKRSVDQSNKYRDLANELTNIFGLGNNPPVRRRFFQKIEDLCVQHGSTFYRAVWRIAQKAIKAEKPGHYFASAVASEIRLRFEESELEHF